MLEIRGQAHRFCDGISRRDFVKIGALTAIGLSLADLYQIEAAQAAQRPSTKPTPSNRSVILIWNHGGPPHMDMVDMKPEAPSEYRGPYKPIKTNVPGIEISEKLPLIGKVMDKITIHRGLVTATNEHFAATHGMLTGHYMPRALLNQGGIFPALGAIASRVLGGRTRDVPAYIIQNDGGFGYHGAAYLGPAYHPLRTGKESYGNEGQQLPVARTDDFTLNKNLTASRLLRRRSMLKDLVASRRDLEENFEAKGLSESEEKAFDMILSGRTQEAFDLSKESAKTHELYGKGWGQNALLARRLVESGARFVTCNTGYWDLHGNIKNSLEHHLPMHDRMIYALLTDLEDRGLLDSVLVITGGEFGRTPKLNTTYGAPGRDHWRLAQSFMVAGAGYKGGQVLGETDAKGETVVSGMVQEEDWVRTVYHALNINTELTFKDFTGRPQYLVEPGKGDVIRGLL